MFCVEKVAEAERYLLGCVFIDNNVMLEISTLSENDFSIYYYRKMFKEMLNLWEEDKEITPLYFDSDLAFNLISSVTTIHSVKHYVEVVRRNAIRNRAIEVAERIKNFCNSTEVEEEESYYSEIDNIIDGLRSEKKGGLITTQEMKIKYMKHLEQPVEKIETGFKRFDEWCGGLGREWLYIMAARPSTGKTAKMLQMALHMAVHGQVLLFSQEMKATSLYSRMLANLTGISLSKIRRKELNQKEIDDIKINLNALEEIYLHIGDKGSYSATEIRNEARINKKKFGKLSGIFIDYLGIMDIQHKSNKTYAQAVGEVSKKMKSLALEIDCPVILLCQLNRESEKTEKPMLSHLRDSGSIEQDADIVEMLWRDTQEIDGDKIINSSIVKGRDTGVNEFKYRFEAQKQKFTDWR